MSNSEITDWWGEIELKITSPSKSWLPAAVLPALITAVLIATPLIFRMSDNNQRGFAEVSGTTSDLPSADSTNMPIYDLIATEEPDQPIVSFPPPESTQPAVDGTTDVPAIPAPLAPARP